MTDKQPAAIGMDALRADLINDLREVFYTASPETPQDIRDVIEYADSWLSVYIRKGVERKALASAAQPSAPRDPLTEQSLRALHHEDQFGLFYDYDEFEQIARAIESAHGITTRKEQL